MAFTTNLACKQKFFGADYKICETDSEGKFKTSPGLENLAPAHEL